MVILYINAYYFIRNNFSLILIDMQLRRYIELLKLCGYESYIVNAFHYRMIGQHYKHLF